MLIKCPKCGFSQPKDEYCANCGIHIPSYKSQESKKGLNHFFFKQFSLLLTISVVIVSLVVSFYYLTLLKNKQKDFKSSVVLYQSKSDHIAKTKNNISNEEDWQTRTQTMSQSSTNSDSSAIQSQKESFRTLEKKSYKNPAMSKNQEVKNDSYKEKNAQFSNHNHNKQIKISAGILSKKNIEKIKNLFQENLLIDPLEPLLVPVEPTTESFLKQVSWTVLNSINLDSDPIDIWLIEGDSDLEQGVTFSLHGTSDLDMPWEFSLIFRALSAKDNELIVREFLPVKIDWAHHKGFLISYTLPRDFKTQLIFKNSKLLKIFESPDFLNFHGELAILLELTH